MSIFDDPWGQMLGGQLGGITGQAVGGEALRRAGEAQRKVAAEALREQQRQWAPRNEPQDYIDAEFEVVEETEQKLIEGKD